MSELERLLTTKEVAEILRISPRTVERLLKRGELKGIRFGRWWRIPPSEVKSFIQKKLEAKDGE